MLKTSLRYLMCVAKHGSIRAASAELNIAQSAISRRLQALEYQLGTSLFERKPRGVVLTEAGQLLYDFCLQSTFAIDRLYSEIDELRNLKRGKVRLASVESAAPTLVCDAMNEFRMRNPNVVFAVDVETSDKVLEIVRKGDVDFGVTLGTDFPDEVSVKFQVREPFLATMSPEHPLATHDRVSIRQLAEWPLALAPKASISRVIFDKCCSQAGLTVSPALESNSVAMTRSFAMASAGITPMLRYAAAASLVKGDLVARPIDGNELFIEVSVITLRDRELPLASERFLTTIIERLQSPEELEVG